VLRDLNLCFRRPIQNSKSIIQNPAAKRRIALCMEYPLRQWGGVEVLVKGLIAGLCEEFDVLLASDDSEESIASTEFATKIRGHFSWRADADYREQARSLSDWLSQERVTIAHFHLGGTYAFRTRSWSQSPIPVVAAAGIPVIATNHGAFALLDFCGPGRSLLSRLAMLPLFWLGRARTLAALRKEITVSDNDLHNMQRWFFPFRSKFERIYHSQLSGDEPLCENREKTILCLGTIGHRKGQPFLVEAFARIAHQFPDWKLIVAGRQDSGLTEMEEIQRTIAGYSLAARVELAGAVSHEEAVSLIRSCGIFAMPSRAEGLGLSLQEALFSGSPAVASRVGGIQDMVIDGETGWLAGVGDVAELASALSEAISNDAARARVGRAARARIIEMGMNREEMLASHRRLYGLVSKSCE